MGWYWVITNDNVTQHSFVAGEGLLDLDEERLRECKSVHFWSGMAWVRSTSAEGDGAPDDSLQNLFAVPIFSARLRRALDLANISGIQYLPIRVIRRSGVEIEGFSVANVLHCVDALDLSLSKYERFPDDHVIPRRRGEIRVVREVVLRRSALAGKDLVRLSSYSQSLYASERFVRLFEGGKFTGLSFQEVQTSE